MKASSFVSALKKIATDYKTVYAWGMFGSVITKSRVEGKAKQYPYWYTSDKVKSVFAPLYGASPAVWGFDCVGLVKAVLWGWNGDSSKTYGGAVYATCGVPDASTESMIGLCSEVSDNMSSIAVGEFLWLPGHCGVYIGGGKVVESTPAWKNGVQITALGARNWRKHGRLPGVEYQDAEGVKNTVTIELSVLRKGSKGEQVKTLQRLLKAFGYKGGDGKALTIDSANNSSSVYYAITPQLASGTNFVYSMDYKLLGNPQDNFVLFNGCAQNAYATAEYGRDFNIGILYLHSDGGVYLGRKEDATGNGVIINSIGGNSLGGFCFLPLRFLMYPPF